MTGADLADLLHEAAMKMRADADVRWHPVADWLLLRIELLDLMTRAGHASSQHDAADAIARTYLGRDA